MTLPSCVVPDECICHILLWSFSNLSLRKLSVCRVASEQCWPRSTTTPPEFTTTTMTLSLTCFTVRASAWAFLSMTNMLGSMCGAGVPRELKKKKKRQQQKKKTLETAFTPTHRQLRVKDQRRGVKWLYLHLFVCVCFLMIPTVIKAKTKCWLVP